MQYSILDFDPSPEALIEPSQIFKPTDIPEHCVICFFPEVIDKVVREQKAKVAAEVKWEDGNHRIYEINLNNKRLAFLHPGIGSPHSAGMLEVAIAFGCKSFIACGGCGVLDKSITLGHLICVLTAVRDEGTSYHYAPPSMEIQSDESGRFTLTTLLDGKGIPYIMGKTWTTDAPYRETAGKVQIRKTQGCIVVDMESAAMIAVARFRKVKFGQLMYGGDDLSGKKWDHRNWQNQTEIRENLFGLCAEAVLLM